MAKSLLTVLGDREPNYEIEQTNSASEYKRFMRFNTVYRNLKHIIPISVITITLGFLIMFTKVFIIGIALLLAATILPFTMIVGSLIYATGFIRKNEWYLSNINTYRFFDDTIYIRSTNKNRYAESVISFESLHKVYETNTNFYIYITKNKSIIISKELMLANGIDIAAFVRYISRRVGEKKMKNRYGLRLKMKNR